MRKRRYKLSNYNFLNERRNLRESTSSITGSTTVDELIALGLLKPDFLATANARLGRKQQRATTQAARGSKLETAKLAIAYFLVHNYGMIPDEAEFHDVRSSKDDKGKKIGFGKKPCEIIVGKVFDAMGIEYNRKVGATNSARFYTDQVFNDLESQGIITNNRDMVSNNAHVRYGKVSDPNLPDAFPQDFPAGENFPTLKEFMQPMIGDEFSFDQGFAGLEDFTYYISDPDSLKMIADQCDQEICDLVDQFTAEAMRADF